MDVIMNRVQPTQLFQLPLTESDVSRFKNPDTQPAEGAINCAAVSAQLIGIITREISSRITSEEQGTYIYEWISSMNEAAGYKAYSHTTCPSMSALFDHLFHGHATMVLATSTTSDIGHYFVIARDGDGTPYILDPQAAKLGDEYAVFQGEERIQTYLEERDLTSEVLAFTTQKPMGVSEHMSLYATSVLSALFERACLV